MVIAIQYLNHFRRKCVENFRRFGSTYNYEMPEYYRNSFYLANASFQDNVNWYFYRAIEVAFDKFIKTSNTASEEKALIQSLNTINVLDSNHRLLELNIPLIKDSGQLEMIKGYCVTHGNHQKIHLGGLSFGTDIQKSHLRALASLASYKHAAVEVPFGGAHSGLKIDTNKFSTNELRTLISSFIAAITENNLFGPQINIFQRDLNCNSTLLNDILEEYSSVTGSNEENCMACVTGKPMYKGGLQNYKGTVSDSIFFTMDNFINSEKMMEKINLTKGWQGKKYVIKGTNKIVARLVDKLSKEGALCVGLFDDDVGYYDKHGIDIDGALRYKFQYTSLLNYFPTYDIKKFLSEECDIMIISDCYKTITCYSAPTINAKIIVELVNGAITPTAHKILLAKGKLVLPDIFINSGFSIASYLEYDRNMNNISNILTKQSTKVFVQNPKLPYFDSKAPDQQFYYTFKDELNIDTSTVTVQKRINSTAEAIMETLEEHGLGLDVRTAIYIMAIQNIFKTLHLN